MNIFFVCCPRYPPRSNQRLTMKNRIKRMVEVPRSQYPSNLSQSRIHAIQPKHQGLLLHPQQHPHHMKEAMYQKVIKSLYLTHTMSSSQAQNPICQQPTSIQ